MPEGVMIVPTTDSKVLRTPLTLVQLLLLNSIICGLEFCASAGFTYIPPMLLKSGISESFMSAILGMGPLLCFFIVPVIGRASDNCMSRYGRRRPFIFVFSIGLLLSLIIIPYGEYLGVFAFGNGSHSKAVGVVLLTLGAILLDFTSQACMTPCEALLSDACKYTNQQDRCFTIYSLMCSLGGCIGYLITSLDWKSSSIGQYFGNQEKSVFSLLILLFLFTMFATICIAEEEPLSPIEVKPSDKLYLTPNNSFIVKTMDDQEGLTVGVNDLGYETSSNQSLSDDNCNNFPLSLQPSQIVHNNEVSLHNEKSLNTNKSLQNSRSSQNDRFPIKKSRTKCDEALTNEACARIAMRVTAMTKIKRIIHSIFSFIALKIYNVLPSTVKNILQIPLVLRKLAFANFCSWTAIMSFNLFFTDFVGQHIYGGNPNADETSHLSHLYDQGVRMGSWGLFLHCITSAIFAAFIENLCKTFGIKATYFFGMLSFTLAMLGMLLADNPALVNIMASLTGFGFATLTTIPFILVTSYHEEKEFFYCDINFQYSTSENKHGFGADMAILDSAYFLSQVILSLFMGSIVSYTGTVLSYIIVAAIFGIISCICILNVITSKQQLVSHMNAQKDPNKPNGCVQFMIL
ncbi:unnamed protein product [Owenia fusiformis]|uniref:Uncharacterized protein n=1 Tax=Owenia fusiformis TaxID=6347 RepID=A0A8J1TZB3_OWEFU|nr:unnamed protein product [Owenia fusiformis]